jgi:hypothetical protein
MDTELGRIAGLLATAIEEQTPLQRRLAGVGRLLLILCLAVVAVTAILQEVYGLEVSPVSDVTEAVCEEVKAWQPSCVHVSSGPLRGPCSRGGVRPSSRGPVGLLPGERGSREAPPRCCEARRGRCRAGSPCRLFRHRVSAPTHWGSGPAPSRIVS